MLAKLLRNFNRAYGHVRRDLALRLLVAGLCVTTRDMFRYEPGRLSPRSRAAAMKRRIRRAAEGDIAIILHDAELARLEKKRCSPLREVWRVSNDNHGHYIRNAMRYARVGEYRRALRTLQESPLSSSNDPRGQEGLAKLHPDPCEPVPYVPASSLTPSYTATPDMVRDIIARMSVTSAPGPDGLTAHVLKPVLATHDDSNTPDVDALSELTQVTNIMLQGDISPGTAEYFCVTSLIDKHNGGSGLS